MTTGDNSNPLHTLYLSAYQMATLKLFTEEGVLYFEEMKTRTGVPSEMVSVLVSRFANVNLLCVANSEHLGPKVYSINPEFRGRRKINWPISQGEIRLQSCKRLDR